MLARLFSIALAAALFLGPAIAAAPPPIPPIPDATRGVTYSISSSTPQVQVPFAVYGDCSDIQVRILTVLIPLPTSVWNCASASGTALASLPLPITDMVVNFTPPLISGQVTITGAWHPRNPGVPTAAGINRREFEQMKGTLIASQRELYSGLQSVGAISLTPVFASPPAIGNILPNTGAFTTLTLAGATSGGAVIAAQAVAGAPVLTMPTQSGTFAVLATSPLILDPITGALTCPTCTATPGLGSVTVQKFTASGTYTPNPKMVNALIECTGPGGGGGSLAASTNTGAGGGASGGFSRALVTAAQVGASKPVTIGPAASGGASGANNAGAAGTPTSVGALCVANGGLGGLASAAVANNGGAPGAAGTGDDAFIGNAGRPGFQTSGHTEGGDGAASVRTGGGPARVICISTATAGVAGAPNSGSGGGGACNNVVASSPPGGLSGSGSVTITEFNSP